MTNLEYIRQLPGMEDAYPDIYGDAKNPPTLCPHWAGLDDTAGGCNGCKDCYLADATIGGKPAPYLFHCPVKPGMTVYRLYRVCDRDDVVIEKRVCCKVGFTIYGIIRERLAKEIAEEIVKKKGYVMTTCDDIFDNTIAFKLEVTVRDYTLMEKSNE